jgi:hypothetical protein
MWPIINTYQQLRHNGLSRGQAAKKLWHILNDLLTLLVAVRVSEKNARAGRKQESKE